VRPFYVTSTESRVPGLEKVIVYFEGEVAIRDTLQEALIAVFGESPNTREEDFGSTEPGGTASEDDLPPEVDDRAVDVRVAELLVEANDLFEQADQALAEGDLGRYEELTDQGRAKVAEAEQLLEEAGATGTTTTTVGASA
jgi:uncharacterized membrane protein (UPF0182 family)